MTSNIERKEIKYYMDLHYPITVHEDPAGGFVAEIEELPGCMTQTDKIDDVFEAIDDARKLWIETAYNDGYDIPLPRSIEKYQGKLLVRIPRSMHRNLVRLAKREGVSLNQYVTSLLASGVTRSVIEPEVDAILIADKIRALSSNLQIFGTAENTIDYNELLSLSPIVLKEKK
jgi:antitoxin HicB